MHEPHHHMADDRRICAGQYVRTRNRLIKLIYGRPLLIARGTNNTQFVFKYRKATRSDVRPLALT